MLAQAAPDLPDQPKRQNSPEAAKPEAAKQSPEAARLDAQIAALTAKRRHISLAGPIVVTSVGGGMILGGGTVAAAAAAGCHDAKNDPSKKCKHDTADALIIGGAAVAGAGLVMVIAGATTLVKRRGERRALAREILDTRRKKESLLKSVSYHFDLDDGRRMLTMQVDF